MKTYTVKSGDSLSLIAGREYGDIHLWPVIAQANPQIKNPNVISPGQVITIPDVSDAVEVQAEVVESSLMPGFSFDIKKHWPWLLLVAVAGGGLYYANTKKKPVKKK